jgi:hypothetical protein
MPTKLAPTPSTPTEPADMPAFVKLVARAHAKQHDSLTYKQYLKLISRFIALQPKPQAGLLMGWYVFHQGRLKDALRQQGITVRPEFTPAKRLPGTATGFARIGEVERLVLKRARRRRSRAVAAKT